ncbi:MAG TPA: signal recognition particle protein Srp19, partial [Candidatus Poseidoniales archaeon]|nr:signal recognition particle protein Srp19 [Candidatus Poseidoniales archaeon]
MALEGLKAGIFGAIARLKGKRKLDEAELKELSKSIRRALLEADFNVRQTKEITARLEERLLEEEPMAGVTLQTHAMN